MEALPRDRWVVVDEVQRMPALLNEVQALIGDHGTAYRFALSGSSARKLKRPDVNLLAGRAINRQFFPLTAERKDGPVRVWPVLSFLRALAKGTIFE